MPLLKETHQLLEFDSINLFTNNGSDRFIC